LLEPGRLVKVAPSAKAKKMAKRVEVNNSEGEKTQTFFRKVCGMEKDNPISSIKEALRIETAAQGKTSREIRSGPDGRRGKAFGCSKALLQRYFN
jgi:hypothetical protein